MRGIFLFTFLLVSTAQAQQEVYGNCASNVEGYYMHESEGLISQYQSAAIDRFEFEKQRLVLLEGRESGLRSCAEVENQSLRHQVKYLNQKIERSGSIVNERAPASLNPVYEEPHSLDEE